ncbi:MAG TPA: hypothetical protein VNW47_11275 [Terriglobales bacterium]|nr:hypothetical protein [Terriglobales bacterium]
MVLTVYCWLLCLYPGSYRREFGEEMTSVFCKARSDLPPALAAKISFYRREFCGLLSGALRAHLDRLFGPAVPFRRFDMQPQFRFPRSTVLLMLVIFAGTVLTIAKASSIAGARPGSVWPSFVSVVALMLLTMCTAAAVVVGILHALRRSGVYRLENVQGRIDSVESNGRVP